MSGKAASAFRRSLHGLAAQAPGSYLVGKDFDLQAT